jgi:CheY-like chemotaxis protein
VAHPYAETGAGTTGLGTGPRVLVVDDEDLIRWSLRECLSAHGYRVVEAQSAAEALERFYDGVDLVLLDYRLPDANGLEVTDQIRQSSLSCPVLLMTAYGTPELREEAARHNVFRIVEKPFDVPEVVEYVSMVLSPTSAPGAHR